MNHIDVMKQALEALVHADSRDGMYSYTNEISALREALAAPQNQLDDINVADMPAPNSVEFDGIGRWQCWKHGDEPKSGCAWCDKQPAQQEPVAWVWNPASEAWERVHVFGHWQQGATYTFGQTPPAAPPPAQQEPAAWRIFDGEGGYEYRSYEMNETYADDWAKHNPRHVGWVEPLYTTPQPAQQTQAGSAAKGAIMGAAYDFRDAHISGSSNLKRSAHAALEDAVDTALNLSPKQDPDALHLAAMDLARKQMDRIADLEAEVARFRADAMNEKSARQAVEQQLAARGLCGWQFYQDGKWHNGMDTGNHRSNTEAAGIPTRDVFSQKITKDKT